METLKKSGLIIVFILAGLFNAGAQDKITSAFAKSLVAETKKNYPEAIAAINQVYDAGSYEMNLRLGWLYYCDKQYSKSAEHYQKAATLMPNATEPLWGSVYPLTALEKWSGLEVVYKEILKRDPGNSKANYYLGSIYYYRKDYGKAKQYLGEALKLYPFDFDTCLLLGWTHYFMGNKAEAIKLFNRVLMQDSTNASALEGIGLCR